MSLLDQLSILFPYDVSPELLTFRLIIYSLLVVIEVGLIFYFLKASDKEEKLNGMKNPLAKFYLSSFVGLFIMTLNTFVSSISLYLSNGHIMLIGHEKAVLYSFGTVIILYGLTFISLSVIDFSYKSETLFKYSYYVAVIVGVVGILFIINQLFVLFPFLTTVVNVQHILTFFMIFYFGLLVSASVGLYVQAKDSPSPLESLRINFAFIAFIVQLLQLFIRAVIILNEGNSDIFVSLVFVVSTIVDFIGYPITILFLTWSLFTPIWLQVKANVIPKEFSYLVS